MQRRNFLSSIVLSIGLIAGLASAASGPASAATPIQPGARIVSGSSACTMNFIYREVLPERASTSGRRTRSSSTSTTTRPRLFAGTAGHCVSGVGARVKIDDTSFGTVAFHRLNDDAGQDFAFIEIDRDKERLVNPSMLGFDGPNGTISGSEAQPGDGVHVYGNGLVFGESELTRPRSGFLNDANGQFYRATLPVIFGDSGGPVLHEDGSALGIVAHLTVATDLTTLDGNTVEYALGVARANGLNLEVVPG
ncbi:MAG TPA: hypothetical protein VMY88_01850 [Acidimicrobiales bacterium]|nr:hypothetical protein [Acidimicrobiales bacterium]